MVIPARPSTNIGMLLLIWGPNTIETLGAKIGACHFCTLKSVFLTWKNGFHTCPDHRKFWYVIVDLGSLDHRDYLCKIWCMSLLHPKISIFGPEKWWSYLPGPPQNLVCYGGFEVRTVYGNFMQNLVHAENDPENVHFIPRSQGPSGLVHHVRSSIPREISSIYYQ